MAELLEPDAENGFALAHVALVAGYVGRREARDLGQHRRAIAAVVEGLAVVETDPVEGRDGAQVHVVGELAAAELPEILEEERRGDDGRARVEGEAVLPVDIGAAAGRIELFQDGDAIAARAKPDGCRETAEAAADHDGMGPAIGLDRGCRARGIDCQH